MPDQHSTARRRLMDQLVRAREASGLSTRQLAERLEWGQPKVSRIERGVVRVRANDVEAWMKAVGADPAATREAVDLALEVAVEAKPWAQIRGASGGAAGQQRKYAELEALTTSITVVQPILVPGLAQTAEYARRVQELVDRPADEIPAIVAARMDRQAVLYDPSKRITLLIMEAVLHQRLGPASMHEGQLHQLASLASLTNVVLGVVPFEVIAPTIPPRAGYTLWEFEEDPALVTVETPTAEVQVTDPDAVQRCSDLAKAWQDVAAIGPAAVELIGRVRQALA